MIRKIRRNAFHDNCKRPCLVRGHSFFNRPVPFVFGSAFRPEPAIHIHRLRAQPDMAHDWNSALDHMRDLRRSISAAFNLHRLTAGFLHDASGV